MATTTVRRGVRTALWTTSSDTGTFQVKDTHHTEKDHQGEEAAEFKAMRPGAERPRHLPPEGSDVEFVSSGLA